MIRKECEKRRRGDVGNDDLRKIQEYLMEILNGEAKALKVKQD